MATEITGIQGMSLLETKYNPYIVEMAGQLNLEDVLDISESVASRLLPPPIAKSAEDTNQEPVERKKLGDPYIQAVFNGDNVSPDDTEAYQDWKTSNAKYTIETLKNTFCSGDTVREEVLKSVLSYYRSESEGPAIPPRNLDIPALISAVVCGELPDYMRNENYPKPNIFDDTTTFGLLRLTIINSVAKITGEQGEGSFTAGLGDEVASETDIQEEYSRVMGRLMPLLGGKNRQGDNVTSILEQILFRLPDQVLFSTRANELAEEMMKRDLLQTAVLPNILRLQRGLSSISGAVDTKRQEVRAGAGQVGRRILSATRTALEGSKVGGKVVTGVDTLAEKLKSKATGTHSDTSQGETAEQDEASSQKGGLLTRAIHNIPGMEQQKKVSLETFRAVEDILATQEDSLTPSMRMEYALQLINAMFLLTPDYPTKEYDAIMIRSAIAPWTEEHPIMPNSSYQLQDVFTRFSGSDPTFLSLFARINFSAFRLEKGNLVYTDKDEQWYERESFYEDPVDALLKTKFLSSPSFFTEADLPVNNFEELLPELRRLYLEYSNSGIAFPHADVEKLLKLPELNINASASSMELTLPSNEVSLPILTEVVDFLIEREMPEELIKIVLNGSEIKEWPTAVLKVLCSELFLDLPLTARTEDRDTVKENPRSALRPRNSQQLKNNGLLDDFTPENLWLYGKATATVENTTTLILPNGFPESARSGYNNTNATRTAVDGYYKAHEIVFKHSIDDTYIDALPLTEAERSQLKAIVHAGTHLRAPSFETALLTWSRGGTERTAEEAGKPYIKRELILGQIFPTKESTLKPYLELLRGSLALKPEDINLPDALASLITLQKWFEQEPDLEQRLQDTFLRRYITKQDTEPAYQIAPESEEARNLSEKLLIYLDSLEEFSGDPDFKRDILRMTKNILSDSSQSRSKISSIIRLMKSDRLQELKTIYYENIYTEEERHFKDLMAEIERDPVYLDLSELESDTVKTFGQKFVTLAEALAKIGGNGLKGEVQDLLIRYEQIVSDVAERTDLALYLEKNLGILVLGQNDWAKLRNNNNRIRHVIAGRIEVPFKNTLVGAFMTFNSLTTGPTTLYCSSIELMPSKRLLAKRSEPDDPILIPGNINFTAAVANSNLALYGISRLRIGTTMGHKIFLGQEKESPASTVYAEITCLDNFSTLILEGESSAYVENIDLSGKIETRSSNLVVVGHGLRNNIVGHEGTNIYSIKQWTDKGIDGIDATLNRYLQERQLAGDEEFHFARTEDGALLLKPKLPNDSNNQGNGGQGSSPVPGQPSPTEAQQPSPTGAQRTPPVPPAPSTVKEIPVETATAVPVQEAPAPATTVAVKTGSSESKIYEYTSEQGNSFNNAYNQLEAHLSQLSTKLSERQEERDSALETFYSAYTDCFRTLVALARLSKGEQSSDWQEALERNSRLITSIEENDVLWEAFEAQKIFFVSNTSNMKRGRFIDSAYNTDQHIFESGRWIIANLEKNNSKAEFGTEGNSRLMIAQANAFILLSDTSSVAIGLATTNIMPYDFGSSLSIGCIHGNNVVSLRQGTTRIGKVQAGTKIEAKSSPQITIEEPELGTFTNIPGETEEKIQVFFIKPPKNFSVNGKVENIWRVLDSQDFDNQASNPNLKEIEVKVQNYANEPETRMAVFKRDNFGLFGFDRFVDETEGQASQEEEGGVESVIEKVEETPAETATAAPVQVAPEPTPAQQTPPPPEPTEAPAEPVQVAPEPTPVEETPSPAEVQVAPEQQTPVPPQATVEETPAETATAAPVPVAPEPTPAPVTTPSTVEEAPAEPAPIEEARPKPAQTTAPVIETKQATVPAPEQQPDDILEEAKYQAQKRQELANNSEDLSKEAKDARTFLEISKATLFALIDYIIKNEMMTNPVLIMNKLSSNNALKVLSSGRNRLVIQKLLAKAGQSGYNEEVYLKAFLGLE